MASLAIVDKASLTYLWISLIQQHETEVLAGTLNVWNYVVMQKRKKSWGGRIKPQNTDNRSPNPQTIL